ncbi:hypothetical protein PG913_11145 [Tenacibaculum pacificus]|uniref:hypothetical protein n=1 Tax=Tenacibaculum pacificus TaxID=3018314 RepID=UPI0022F3A89D|nr:hypothetical protein [Tenacibaculum pacificus]WBX73390.1 hypothetical protein PG913_11145 [Tenacibaculum pacificus]
MIPADKMLLTIYYIFDGVIYSDTLQQDEISTSSEIIDNVTKIKVEVYGEPPVTMHGTNARLLLHQINKYNLLKAF